LELAQDDDSIGFSADLVGRVLELDGTPLEISSSVYIDGMIGEDRITLKTDGSYTAISVTGDTNSGAGVILSGLIIQGGETEKEVTGSIGADSAIVNLGALTLSNVEVTD